MFGRTRFRLLKDDFFNIQSTIGDDNDSSLASLTAILDESLLDASRSEATEVQSRKGTKSAVKPTRKGRTSAEKVQINRLERSSQTHKACQKMARREKCLGEQPTAIHLR